METDCLRFIWLKFGFEIYYYDISRTYLICGGGGGGDNGTGILKEKKESVVMSVLKRVL